MKRLTCTIVLAIICLLMAPSCTNISNYGKHSFFLNVKHNIESSETLDAIKAEFDKDPYFSSPISATGNFDEVCTEMIQNFRSHCDALDAEFLESKLKPNEYYRVDFWSCDPAENWISFLLSGKEVMVEQYSEKARQSLDIS